MHCLRFLFQDISNLTETIPKRKEIWLLITIIEIVKKNTELLTIVLITSHNYSDKILKESAKESGNDHHVKESILYCYVNNIILADTPRSSK